MAENTSATFSLVEDEMSGFDGNKETRKEIISQHYKKLIEEGSKEMNPGGVQKRLIDNQVVEIMVPNQQEIYINHIEMLRLALLKDIELDAETVSALQKFDNKLIYLRRQFRNIRETIYNKIDSLSMTINPEGYSERDVYENKYRSYLNKLQKRYNNRLLELYKEELLPYLILLLSKRNILSE